MLLSCLFEGVEILSNQYSVTHDEKMYKDADSFGPDRFIDSEGNFKKPENKHFVPFGIGNYINIFLKRHLDRHFCYVKLYSILMYI